MDLLKTFPQIWVWLSYDIDGNESPDYHQIIMITGVRQFDENHASYACRYLASGKNCNVIFNKCYWNHRDWFDNPSYGLITKGRRIDKIDLLQYMYLPKKSHLFDRIISGNYPRLEEEEMQIILHKNVVKRAMNRKRLPKEFKLYLSGAVLYDILPKYITLTKMNYWVHYHSLNKEDARLVWSDLPG